MRIGVIGTGNIGLAHARSIAREVAGAAVTAIFDPDRDRADEAARTVDARACTQVRDLIEADDVDAIIIASPDDLHAEQALACLQVGKPTLVEKPLAPAVDDALALVRAEARLGRRLLTVGFMRRFDPGYTALKAQLDAGLVGEALIVRNVHRNRSAPYGLLSERTMTNMAIHEMDVNRWLLDDELASVQVIAPRPGPDTPAGQFDPMLIIFRTASGTLVEIEAFVNAHYGYEVTCQVVASRGVLDMSDGSFITRTATALRGQDIPELWLGRFGDAYRRELQAWVGAIRGLPDDVGATAWDGLAATLAAQAAAEALRSGTEVILESPTRPAPDQD